MLGRCSPLTGAGEFAGTAAPVGDAILADPHGTVFARRSDEPVQPVGTARHAHSFSRRDEGT